MRQSYVSRKFDAQLKRHQMSSNNNDLWKLNCPFINNNNHHQIKMIRQWLSYCAGTGWLSSQWIEFKVFRPIRGATTANSNLNQRKMWFRTAVYVHYGSMVTSLRMPCAALHSNNQYSVARHMSIVLPSSHHLIFIVPHLNRFAMQAAAAGPG